MLEKIVALFVSPEVFDSVMLGFDFAIALGFVVLLLIFFALTLFDVLFPWLKRKFKLNKAKGGEQ